MKKSQAAAVEMVFILVILFSVFSYTSTFQDEKNENLNFNSEKAFFEKLLLENKSSYYIQDLIRNDISLTNSNWNTSKNLLFSFREGNIFILNSSFDTLESELNCDVSILNEEILFFPIYMYNSSHHITETKYFKFTICNQT